MVCMLLRRSRNFRLLWTGQVISVIGDGMQRIALLWWAAHTHGAGVLTALAIAAVLPVVALSPLGGWLADHHDRRRLMLAADAGRLATTAALALLMVGGRPPVLGVLALVVLTTVGTAVFDPAYGAAVPHVVEPDDLAAANGLDIANGALGGLVGPLVGSLLLAAFSPAVVLAVNAATFAWSASQITRLHMPARVPYFDERVDGQAASAREVFAGGRLRRLIGVGALLNLVVAPVPLLLVSLAVRRFDATSIGYGALQVSVSAGLLVGSLLAGRSAPVPVVIPIVAAGALLAIAGGLAYRPTIVVFVFVGIAVAIANSLLMVEFQHAVPPAFHGRAFGLAGAISEGLRPLGLLLTVPLLAAAGVTTAFVVVGVALASCALLLLPRPVAASHSVEEHRRW
jgi:MFS transporter, DHA3 family, macrolide efflux protein